MWRIDARSSQNARQRVSPTSADLASQTAGSGPHILRPSDGTRRGGSWRPERFCVLRVAGATTFWIRSTRWHRFERGAYEMR